LLTVPLPTLPKSPELTPLPVCADPGDPEAGRPDPAEAFHRPGQKTEAQLPVPQRRQGLLTKFPGWGEETPPRRETVGPRDW